MLFDEGDLVEIDDLFGLNALLGRTGLAIVIGAAEPVFHWVIRPIENEIGDNDCEVNGCYLKLIVKRFTLLLGALNNET